jgi:hypothetical protein
MFADSPCSYAAALGGVNYGGCVLVERCVAPAASQISDDSELSNQLDAVSARVEHLKKTGLSEEVALNKAVAEKATENNVALYAYQTDRFRKIN